MKSILTQHVGFFGSGGAKSCAVVQVVQLP